MKTPAKLGLFAFAVALVVGLFLLTTRKDIHESIKSRLQSDDSRVREAAAEELVGMDRIPDSCMSAAIACLGDTSQDVRKKIVMALSRNAKEALPLLLIALHHTDPLVRAQATRALGSPNPKIRRQLTPHDDEMLLPILTDLLRDEDTLVKISAAESIVAVSCGAGKPAVGLRAVVNALPTADADVRASMIRAIGRIIRVSDSRLSLDFAVSRLINEAKHSDPRVRAEALWALSEVRDLDYSAVSVVVESQIDDSDEVRSAGYFCLRNLKRRKGDASLLPMPP